MSGRIFFYLLTDKNPSGGMHQAYRQAALLRQLGWETHVVHPVDGFRYSFSDEIADVVPLSSVSLTREDAFVVPEIVQGIPNVPGLSDAIRVVNVQNHFLVTIGMRKNLGAVRDLYRGFASHIVTNSSEGEKMLRWIFPEKRTFRYWYSFDKEPFTYRGAKKRQLCWMPRKRPQELDLVYSYLWIMNAFQGWVGIPIQNKTDKEVAEIMKDSVLFLSFSDKEGFGMPPCEAMACGCVVIGYHGVGGKEYFGKDFCVTIDENDTVQFARTLIGMMGKPQEELVSLGKQASGWVTGEYSTAKEIASLKAIWTEIMAQKG